MAEAHTLNDVWNGTVTFDIRHLRELYETGLMLLDDPREVPDRIGDGAFWFYYPQHGHSEYAGEFSLGYDRFTAYEEFAILLLSLMYISDFSFYLIALDNGDKYPFLQFTSHLRKWFPQYSDIVVFIESAVLQKSRPKQSRFRETEEYETGKRHRID